MSALKYWVWLSSAAGVSAQTAQRLVGHFGSPEKVFFARGDELREVPDIRPAEVAALCVKDMSAARRMLDDSVALGLRIVTPGDAEYPERLRNIFGPPSALYVRGTLPVIDEEAAVAVVGTRSCTPYGVRAAEKMGYELARAGCLVVTGLARGIDTAAAKGALRAGGRVLGVLACGLDVVYPPENARLFEDVAASGALLSEYPPGSPPDSRHFPVRNRILSGVSLGVAVIEAPKRSGALITASRALEQGRDVFVLPGNVDSPASEGSNTLLREGASPVTSGWDIAEEYRALFPDKLREDRRGSDVPLSRRQAEKLGQSALRDGEKRQEKTVREIDTAKAADYIDIEALTEGLSKDEASVVRAIGTGRVHVDDLITGSGLPAAQVLAMLTMLEIRGVVVQEKGKFFTLPEAERRDTQ